MRSRNFVLAIAVTLSFAATAESFPAASAPMKIAQAVQSESPQPGRVQKLRQRTKESWSQMKRRWSLQREKYAGCRKDARAQRLVGIKTRKFLEECMTR